ncbi:MAG: hypothetical protein QMC89_02230 [Candidatus Hodarchaeaceae archaeon]|nr:hypothetical protein [Candidatus Hodarchaeaceae archaeon]
MQEVEIKLVYDSFSHVMAYLVYPQELREKIDRVLGESENIKVFTEKLKQVISVEADSTHKTDGQIFLNELRKHLT